MAAELTINGEEVDLEKLSTAFENLPLDSLDPGMVIIAIFLGPFLLIFAMWFFMAFAEIFLGLFMLLFSVGGIFLSIFGVVLQGLWWVLKGLWWVGAVIASTIGVSWSKYKSHHVEMPKSNTTEQPSKIKTFFHNLLYVDVEVEEEDEK